jgi:hypothetical protein
MEPENISNIGNYLVNGSGGGGFRLQSFSPITTLNHSLNSLNSLKGGSENTNANPISVAHYILGGDTFAIPSYAYSGGKITNEPIHNNNGEVSVIDDDLHKKLLELAKDDTNTNENKNTNVKHRTKKRKNELHLFTRKKYAKKVDKNNKTRRQSK